MQEQGRPVQTARSLLQASGPPPQTPCIAWGLMRPTEVLVQEVWAGVWDPVPMCVQVPVAVVGALSCSASLLSSEAPSQSCTRELRGYSGSDSVVTW